MCKCHFLPEKNIIIYMGPAVNRGAGRQMNVALQKKNPSEYPTLCGRLQLQTFIMTYCVMVAEGFCDMQY